MSARWSWLLFVVAFLGCGDVDNHDVSLATGDGGAAVGNPSPFQHTVPGAGELWRKLLLGENKTAARSQLIALYEENGYRNLANWLSTVQAGGAARNTFSPSTETWICPEATPEDLPQIRERIATLVREGRYRNAFAFLSGQPDSYRRSCRFLSEWGGVATLAELQGDSLSDDDLELAIRSMMSLGIGQGLHPTSMGSDWLVLQQVALLMAHHEAWEESLVLLHAARSRVVLDQHAGQRRVEDLDHMISVAESRVLE